MQVTDEIGHITVNYICPECKYEIERQIPYLKNDKGEKELASAGWCSQLYCDAKHKFIYKAFHEGPQIEIKELFFFNNEEEHKIKLKILA